MYWDPIAKILRTAILKKICGRCFWNENYFIKDETNEDTSTIEKAVYQCLNHRSIFLIRNKVKVTSPFSLNEASLVDVKEEMLHVNSKTAGTSLKCSINLSSEKLKQAFNDVVIYHEFPNELKKTDIKPVFKKDDSTKVKNYSE